MDAEEKLINLTTLVSVPEAVKSTPEIINIMSTSADSPLPILPQTFFPLAVWVEFDPQCCASWSCRRILQ